MKLQRKLLLTHIAVALVAILLITAVANVTVNRYFNDLATKQAKQAAQEFAPALADCYEIIGNWDFNGQRCMKLGPRPFMLPQMRHVIVVDIAGEVVFDSRGRGPKANKQPANVTQRDIERGEPISATDGTVIGTVIVRPNEGQFGADEDYFLSMVRRNIWLAGAITALLALAIGFRLARTLAAPLRGLTTAVHQLAQGERSVQVDESGNDEIAELSQAFNSMSNELQRSEQVRRQMVADIAHELRTPLSVLQIELESIEDGVSKPTPAVISSLGEEVQQLNHLIEDLRTLSLADAGQLSLNPVELEPHEVVNRVVNRMQLAAREKQLELANESAEQLAYVHADPSRLQQVLVNLLQNAVRYTPQGGKIRVTARQSAGEVILGVHDTGAGFDPSEAATIFERFYRTDKARARETGGTGLGLAIVKGLVTAMGGRVWATSVPNQGSSFYVALRAISTKEGV
ncbi:ATP-binding protein [Herpetosiphon geysericola]|uniref:ATP-binding protein n=1 Tax=Herpetosiphon geysericola TaxID=70996 RepID=UPI0006C8FB55|nr:ATP-binding protein [Herpetosiphon geysericola]